jgi:hypothetical protein
MLMIYGGWGKNISLDNVNLSLKVDGSTFIPTNAITSTSWQQFTNHYATILNSASAEFDLVHVGSSGQQGRFDDVSLKQVLTPSATGVTIVSTQGGSTYNWTSDSGINGNSASFTAVITAQ